MIRLALILAALLLAGCGDIGERRLNPGAPRAWFAVGRDYFKDPTILGSFDHTTGAIRVRNDLPWFVACMVAVHEFVHACEAWPRLMPRDVLALYACPAFPLLAADLVGAYVHPPKLIP